MRFPAAVCAALVVLVSAPLAASPLRPPRALASYVEGMQRGQCRRLLAPLETLAAQDDATGARAAYLLAACLQRTGRLHAARAGFDAAAARHPALSAHARLAAGELALRLGEAEAALRDARAAAIRPSLARRARLLEGEALVRLGRFRDAEDILRALTPRLTERTDQARAWWWRAQASEGRGTLPVAAYEYAIVAWGFPDTTLAADASRRLKQINRPLRPPAAARLYRARWLMRSGRPVSAERELIIAVRGPLTGPDAAEAWFTLGFLRLPSRRIQAARDFLNAARFFHGSDRALYWAGRALAAGRRADGDRVWRRLLNEHPRSPWSARATYSRGLAAETAGAWETADPIYEELARRFPATPRGQEAAWRRGWWRYRRGKLEDAAAVFVNAARAHPRSVRAAACLYWAAMAQLRMGRSSAALLAELATNYPLNYYGRQARRRLGIPLPVPQSPAAPEPGGRFGPTYEELGALGFHREAADDAEQASPSADHLHFIAYHRAQAGQLHESVAAAARALAASTGQAAVPERELWMLAYPLAFRDSTIRAAEAAGIDPFLVFAVTREESRFDPAAVSPAGAIGLMQLLPSTARYLIPDRTAAPGDLMRPDVNLRYGAVYLRRLLARFGGDTLLAAAAYNAGPGAARRFTRTIPRTSEAEFLESIPLDETRTYLRRVLETYGIYRWLYR